MESNKIFLENLCFGKEGMLRNFGFEVGMGGLRELRLMAKLKSDGAHKQD